MFEFCDDEWQLLKLMQHVLHVNVSLLPYILALLVLISNKEPAAAQATFLSEAFPTVWKLLPTLEFMQSHWEDFFADPHFKPVKDGIRKGLEKLQQYYKKADITLVNVVCLSKSQ